MNPILALDISSLFAIGFVLISFIGWIMNLINAQNPPPQPKQPARRPVPRDGKVQNEIEVFLQEAMGRRAPQQPQLGGDDIEIIEPAPQRRRPPQQRPPQRKPLRRKSQTPATSRPPVKQQSLQPGERLSSRRLTSSSDRGQNVRSHADDHMQSRVGAQIEQDLPHLVDQGVARNLGEFLADDNDTRRSVAPHIQSRAAVKGATGLIAALREPAGIRQAIMLQQILSKPRALRPRGAE